MWTSAPKSILPTTPPQELGEFKKLPMVNDEYNIPELPDRRFLTDVKFLVVVLFMVIFLLPFMIYTLVHSDITRLLNGYDICGNVCGENNPFVEGINCSGKNYENDPVLLYKTDIVIATRMDEGKFFPTVIGDEMVVIPYNCTTAEYCENGHDMKLLRDRCLFIENVTIEVEEKATELHNITDIQEEHLKITYKGLGHAKGFIALMMFIAVVICYLVMLLFRYAVGFFVWFILLGTFSMLVFATILYWYLQATIDDPDLDKTPITTIAVFLTIISLICLFFLITMFKRISLLIQIFEETMKAIFAMPLILLQPLVTFALMFLVVASFIYFMLIYYTSGILEKDEFGYYSYIPNGAMLFTRWYHAIITVLLLCFISGCQDMIIGGAISAWYFTREKETLVSPIKKSIYCLFRFHLGTVACGSILILILKLIRQIAVGLSKSRFVRACMAFFLQQIEKFFAYFSSNAYIETAMHGQPFYESGKRAIRLLIGNIFNVVALKSVGSFVFFMAKLLIVVITVVIGHYLKDDQNEVFPLVLLLCGIFALILACSFFSLFETAVDTIYLCFCEDNAMNDGVSRPYYMSPGLMKFIEETKTTIPINPVTSENLKPALPEESKVY